MIDQLLRCISDPQVFAVNRLAAHSDHAAFCDADVCALDGAWAFAFFDDVHELDASIFSCGECPHTVHVPGHIELQGFGRPQYTNIAYPWDGHEALVPPQLPSHNPIGVYVKAFTLPDGWLDRRIVLTLEGYAPCCFVTLNGTFVGYAEDGFTPAEFALCGLLRAGENRLCIAVPRFATACWLNDQDFWRFSGLFRSVRLRALSDVSLFDVEWTAEPSEDFASGKLSARITLDSATCLDAEITLSCNGASVSEPLSIRHGMQDATLSLTLEGLRLWSVKRPIDTTRFLRSYRMPASCLRNAHSRSVSGVSSCATA